MIQPSQLSRWIYEKGEIWQWDLQNPSKFVGFINDRKVNFWQDHLILLWELGWIRAEIIQGKLSTEIDGIDTIEKSDDEEFVYADNRILGKVQLRKEEPANEIVQKISGVVPYFHPFKFFVLWEIQRIIQLNIQPYKMFFPGRNPGILDREIDDFYRWIQNESAKALINRWDEITRLAIASEPCFFSEIIGSFKFPPRITAGMQRANILAYKELLKDHYLHIGIDPIKEIIENLCCSAEMIEPNKNIHTLMRFMNGSHRLKITGNLGGAVLLKFMAEIIRRMSEWSFGIQLPEEDEMGFGMWVEGAKEENYGTKRIFDTKGLLAKRQFMRELGLDANVRIRIYVEGPTEYAAFSHLLKHWQQIEVIDLGGQFIQKNKKGIGFRESLIIDDHSGVFSMIIVDGDREDNLRVVKTAAEEDLYCGQFYIFNPDFEFHNFTTKELFEIIRDLISKEEKSEQLDKLLKAVVDSATNAETLMSSIKRNVPSLNIFNKGKKWGESLAEFATKKPEFDESKKIRPFIEACQTAIRSIYADFLVTRTKLKTDPDTGKLINR